MKEVLTSVFVAALLVIGSTVNAAESDVDPVVGTWKLNLPKSTFAGIPAYKSQTRIYSQSGQDVTLKMITVDEKGKTNTTQATYKLNGKDFSSMGNPDFDSLAGVRIDTNTVEFTLKKAGKQIGKIRREVSNDRQTLTISFVVSNAAGIQTAALMLFDRQ